MKIAVAALDGRTVSPHFGRSACFIVFEIKEGKIAGREVRDNTYTPHAKGECSGEHGAGSSPEHAHGHAGILAALHDCEAVICRGMGWRAAEDLGGQGIKALVTDAEGTPDELVEAFLSGSLATGPGFCRCHG
jgi:predicted Fe-Mo cluster-binding NifX family protein